MSKLIPSLVGSALIAAGAASAADGPTLYTRGGQNSAALACIGCHGPDARGVAAAGFPRLAGLPAGYLRKQLLDFRSGSRRQPVMEPLAQALTAAEIDTLSAYLASLPVDRAPTLRRAQIANDSITRLALYGDWDRSIPGCVQCHGPDGAGVGEHFPALSGQPAAYLAGQLNAWREGSRRNDPNDLMVTVAKAMTPEEVEAVAALFARPAQPETQP